MVSVHEMVMEWHRAFNVPVGGRPGLLENDREHLRVRLITEEYKELLDAVAEKNFIEQLDALGDLVYVCYGMAIELGANLDKIIEEIHRSNLSKLDENSDPIFREDGKVLKGPWYSPPNIIKVVFD